MYNLRIFQWIAPILKMAALFPDLLNPASSETEELDLTPNTHSKRHFSVPERPKKTHNYGYKGVSLLSLLLWIIITIIIISLL